jgi:hypothetical protein
MLSTLISLLGAALVVIGAALAFGEHNMLVRINASLSAIAGLLFCILATLWDIRARLRGPR